MARLTDTQLIILSAASQRDDRGVELPANIIGEAARKAVDKLIRASLLEEVDAAGSLPVWRRDDESRPMALRITKNGLDTIAVEDEAVAAPKKTSTRPDAVPGKAEGPAAEAVASRKQIVVARQKGARKQRYPGKAKSEGGSRLGSQPGKSPPTISPSRL